MFTLWSIFRNPLIFGGDLTKLDDFTLNLITNPEVIAVNQEGSNPRQVQKSDGIYVWRSDGPEGQYHAAIFNPINKQPHSFTLQFSAIDSSLAGKTCQVRDLWARKDIGALESSFTVNLEVDGTGLFSITDCK